MTIQVVNARRKLARRNTIAGLTALGPGEFEGYASLFAVADGAGDRVAQGAFAASLRRRGAGAVRMLYQHFSHAPIGVWEEITEDHRGLYVRGRLSTGVEQARDVHALLADARAELARLAAQQRVTAQGAAQARAHLAARASAETQIQTVVKEVPVYVSAASDAKCVLPVGAVRLLDAAASGAGPAQLRDHVAPGEPDDAASDVTLSEAVALLAANLGAARLNAAQLEHLQRALTPE